MKSPPMSMFPKASLTGRVVRTNNTMRMAKSWGIMAAARCRRHMSDNPVHGADDRVRRPVFYGYHLDNVELGRRPWRPGEVGSQTLVTAPCGLAATLAWLTL